MMFATKTSTPTHVAAILALAMVVYAATPIYPPINKGIQYSYTGYIDSSYCLTTGAAKLHVGFNKAPNSTTGVECACVANNDPDYNVCQSASGDAVCATVFNELASGAVDTHTSAYCSELPACPIGGCDVLPSPSVNTKVYCSANGGGVLSYVKLPQVGQYRCQCLANPILVGADDCTANIPRHAYATCEEVDLFTNDAAENLDDTLYGKCSFECNDSYKKSADGKSCVSVEEPVYPSVDDGAYWAETYYIDADYCGDDKYPAYLTKPTANGAACTCVPRNNHPGYTTCHGNTKRHVCGTTYDYDADSNPIDFARSSCLTLPACDEDLCDLPSPSTTLAIFCDVNKAGALVAVPNPAKGNYGCQCISGEIPQGATDCTNDVPSHATATCLENDDYADDNGVTFEKSLSAKCSFACIEGYQLSEDQKSCALVLLASQRAKRDVVVQSDELCPTGFKSCPLSAGGYECIGEWETCSN